MQEESKKNELAASLIVSIWRQRDGDEEIVIFNFSLAEQSSSANAFYPKRVHNM